MVPALRPIGNSPLFKQRLIARINRSLSTKWPFELDPESILPFRKRELPKKVNAETFVSLSPKCKFDPAELIGRYQIKVSGLLHVGAHKGEEIPSYLDAGVRHAVLIEPLMENFRELTRRIKGIDGFIAFQNAAGDVNQITEIHLASNDLQSSSILKPALHLAQVPEIKFQGVEKVLQIRIDDLDLNIKPNFWVIDVQGYEMQVLKGAEDKIQDCEYIFIEINRGEVYENCTKIADLDLYLNNLGFQRVLFRWWPLWGDGFYVRKDLFPLVLNS